MPDNRFAMMGVNRSGDTSRSGHGDTAVQAGFEEAGITSTQGHANVGAWRDASRGGASMRSHAADGDDLGANASRGSARVATQTARASSGAGRAGSKAAVEAPTRRRSCQWLSQRA